ncbi:MAG: hypothetical protein KF779_03645 [Hyphomonadaceae bacterium]|nr:hypothetical protein [Hyphomonadaceae bacterium]MCA8886033.1 hypothetical protein [Hyphomonadaceae bacterium]
MSKSHAKRFVGAAWALLSFQVIASVGAVAATGLAAMHVAEMAHELEAQRQAPAQAEAVEQAADPEVAGAETAATEEPAPVQDQQTPAVPAVAQCLRSGRTIRVQANVEWCDTGIDLRRGQRMAIGAEGRWTYLGEPIYAAAGSGTRANNSLFPRAPLAALIGRVGDQQFLIGQGGQTEAVSDGRLYLSMNDVSGTFGDNSGYMDVYIQFPEEAR